MIKSNPSDLAVDLLNRSVCAVQCASVIFDRYGIFSWGWNSAGSDGLGEHAEASAIRRANRARLAGASIAIAGRRKRNNKIVVAFPCTDCAARLSKVGVRDVWVQSKFGEWQRVFI